MDRPGSTTNTTKGVAPEETHHKKRRTEFIERAENWLAHKDKDEWVMDMKRNLGLVATVIATMTFQIAINQPGGVVQLDAKDDLKCRKDSEQHYLCPGEATFGSLYPDVYFRFLLFNTIAFVSSLGVCLLIVSGLPLNHRVPLWLLSTGMCITLTSLALTYMSGASMVTPNSVWGETMNAFTYVILTWFVLLGIIGVFFMIRFVIWGLNIYIKKRYKSTVPRDDEEIPVNHD